VQVAPASAKGTVRAAEILAALIQATEFTGQIFDVTRAKDFEAGGLTEGLLAEHFDLTRRHGGGNVFGADTLGEGLEGSLLF